MKYTKLNNTIDLPKTSPKFISDATDIFTGWIHSYFKHYKLTEDEGRKEQTMNVYDLTKDGTFKDIFDSFERKLDDMVVSQGQVIEFAKTLKKGDKYDYFFLLKNVDGEFFVVDMFFGSDGHLGVGVLRFSRDGVWYAECRHRLVIPATNSSETLNTPVTLRDSDSLTLALKNLKEKYPCTEAQACIREIEKLIK